VQARDEVGPVQCQRAVGYQTAVAQAAVHPQTIDRPSINGVGAGQPSAGG
jgi:hypothetical protein